MGLVQRPTELFWRLQPKLPRRVTTEGGSERSGPQAAVTGTNRADGARKIEERALSTAQSTARHPGVAAPAGGGKRHLGLALFVIATAQLMVVLDATIVNVALPHIQKALGFSGSGAPGEARCTISARNTQRMRR
jgi:hypothetical protein